MKTLSNNWLTEGLTDFEYKKYVLLAYLQDVNSSFSQTKLYPQFSELIFHYKNAMSFKNSKKTLSLNFPKQLSKADFQNFVLDYENVVADDATMSVIDEVLEFAIEAFSKTLADGSTIYQTVEGNLSIEPIGLMPLRTEEGYFFLKFDNDPDTRVYRFQVSIFENADEKFRGIHTEYIDTVQKRVSNTYENLKLDIIKRYTMLPNPATYFVESKLKCAIEETVLPITKRALVKHLADAA